MTTEKAVPLDIRSVVEGVVKEALGMKTTFVSVNDACPYVLIDQYLHAVGVGRSTGLAHLLKEGYIERIDDKAALKAIGLTRGDGAVFVPTDKGDVCLQCPAGLPEEVQVGRNTTKLLVKVPEGIDYLTAKVFTQDVRVELYKTAWA